MKVQRLDFTGVKMLLWSIISVTARKGRLTVIKIGICILFGYFLGSFSPSAWIARLKKSNLREQGTQNLGATNTMVVFGLKFGIAVMLFDAFKSYISYMLAVWIAPEYQWLAMASGFAAILGHCFSVYLDFKGGKGLASFGGLLLAYDPVLFCWLLVACTALMLIVNHSYIVPFSASVAFVTYVAWTETNVVLFLFALFSAIILVERNFENFLMAVRKEDTKIRSYLKEKFSRDDQAE